MGKVKRSLIASFLNTGTPSVPVWSLLGSGVTSALINYNPKVLEETYVNQDSASISVEGYAPVMPVEYTAMAGTDVFTYLDGLMSGRSVLSAAETELVNVWLYKTPSLGFYLAEKQLVSVQIDSFGGDGGAAAKMSFTVSYQGEPVVGEFSPVTSAFVPAPVSTIITTLSIGGLTLTPDFAVNHSWTHYTLEVPNATSSVVMSSTKTGCTITQRNGVTVVAQGGSASLAVGVNHLSVEVNYNTGEEITTYYVDVTRLPA